VLKLLRGEIHLLQNDLPPELFAHLEEQTGITVDTHPGTNFTYLGLNLEDAATGDVRVRRAIAHAIDREAIARHVFRGRVALAEVLFPPDHWLGARLAPHARDLDRARTLLAAAGYDESRPLVLNYKTSSDPFRLRLASILQAQLGDAGIEVRLRSYDWGTFFGDIKAGNFQLYSLTWVGLKTPDSFRYLFHSDSLPPKGANRGRYRSTRADGLIEQAETLPRPEDQAPVYRELERLLHDELPYVPLWYEDHVAAYRDEVLGYRMAADGNYDGLSTIRWNR
jgi:peptide/nickel transport system substrate-binding protein